MSHDLVLVALSAGLTAVGVAVGWLVLRVIENSRDVAVIQSRLSEADISGNFERVHSRITTLSEDTHRVLGVVEAMERRQARIEDYLIGGRGLPES